ncbi:MAG: efflux RND transporter periplasmic adaptor subunit [Bacteroidota bacterium]|nr:efflux RND transporter periplasmic adaptor subunit [Bacteroidota bacterium]
MKRIKLVGIVVCALALGFSSCKKTEKTDTKEANEIPNVRVQEAIVGDIDQTYELTATVQPEAKNSIAPATPGRIRHILVEVGQHVSKGQKLVQMDVANLSNSETQIENVKRTYKRTQELFNVGGASQQELDNAKLQLDVAQTNLKNLSENTFLISPISGVVTERNYDNGDMYSSQKPVLVVMNINPVKVLINVSESYYSQVKLGMPVDVKFDIFQGAKFQGKVSLIYPTIDMNTRTFPVEIKLNNSNNKVRPGMFARVTMEFGKAKRVLVLDQAIIKQSGSGARFVYVYNNGKVEYKQVEIGRRIESNYEIISGISAGDQVVVAGQSKLVDGASVKLVK